MSHYKEALIFSSVGVSDMGEGFWIEDRLNCYAGVYINWLLNKVDEDRDEWEGMR